MNFVGEKVYCNPTRPSEQHSFFLPLNIRKITEKLIRPKNENLKCKKLHLKYHINLYQKNSFHKRWYFEGIPSKSLSDKAKQVFHKGQKLARQGSNPGSLVPNEAGASSRMDHQLSLQVLRKPCVSDEEWSGFSAAEEKGLTARSMWSAQIGRRSLKR